MTYKEEMILARQLAKQEDKVNRDNGKSREVDPYADLYACMTIKKTRVSNLKSGYAHRYTK